MLITFTVAGLPGTKGSARAFVRGKRAIVVNDAGDKARAWASQVADAARAAMAGRAPLDEAVSIFVQFYLPRPQSHYLRPTKKYPMRNSLREDAPSMCSGKPDGDKLERCLWDALTEIVFRDDSQIVAWTGSKYYADPVPVGARVEVSTRRLETEVPRDHD